MTDPNLQALERKVLSAASWVAALHAVGTVANFVLSNPGYLSVLPSGWQGIVMSAASFAVALTAGYYTYSNRVPDDGAPDTEQD